MKQNKMAVFTQQLERRWGEDVFVLDFGKEEILCEKNHINGNLYVYHPIQPIYSIIRNWEWTPLKIYQLYRILKIWGIL